MLSCWCFVRLLCYASCGDSVPAAIRENIAVPTIRISEYLGLVITLIFWLGVIFELPLVMFLLAKLRLISYQRLKRVRKFVPPVALIVSAILTPTMDIVKQLMLAGPIIVLYEVGLSLAWLAQPGKGRLVIRKIKALLVGILRRIAVILILVPSLLAGVLFVTALSFVFLWDGHLSTGTPSRAADRLDRVYIKVLTVIAKVVRISQGHTS